MKRAVFELVRKYGIPPSNESTLSKTEQKIVDAINAGADTLNEIQEATGLSRESVLTGLSKMYELAEYDGVRYKNKRNKFVEFIKWVRGEQL
jgi:DNA-binding CsgD family transcriptional regulator